MKNVVTMVGSSIFENYKKSKDDEIYNDLKDKSFLDIEDYEEDCRDLKASVIKWAKDKPNASAEIKSLLKIKDEVKENLSIHLITTDTILSPLAAEIIKEWFEGKEGFEVHFEKEYGKDVIKGLQVRNSKNFEEQGLMNLVERIEEIIDRPENTIFNITGGYKAVVPFLTFYAQLYKNKIPTYYIFEIEDELIKLPQLPISLDFDLIEDNFFAFEVIHPKTLKEDLPTKEEFLLCLYNEKQEAEEAFKRLQDERIIIVIDSKVKLTVYGRLIFNFFKQKTSIQQLKGTLVELKVFEYIFNKYGNNSKVKIYHSKPFGKKAKPVGEVDVLVVDKINKEIRVVEVKSGGSKKSFEDIKNKTIQKLLPEVKKWAEKKYLDFKIYLDIYLYRSAEILEKFSKYKNNCEELNNIAKEIRWYWLKIDENIYQPQAKIEEKKYIFEWR